MCNICIEFDKSKMDKGRAFDGRRAYRCPQCNSEWTDGMQGALKKYSVQRLGNQFYNTGAINYKQTTDQDRIS